MATAGRRDGVGSLGRAYLYYLELTLKDQEITASLPWWDWSSTLSHAQGLPAAYTAETGVDGQPNPLAGATINDLARQQGGRDTLARTFRQPDALSRLPTAAHVRDLLGLGDFLDFQQQLEQVHDSMHVWVGGTMQEIPFAAYDPIFFAHHAMVDRLWRLWQLRHPTAALPDSMLNEALPPFNITVRQTLSVTALGYDYASFSSRAQVGG